MANFLPALLTVLFYLVLGYALGRTRRLPAASHRVLGAWVIQVALPAMVFTQIRGLLRSAQPMSAVHYAAALMPWLVFALGWGFFRSLEKVARMRRGGGLASRLPLRSRAWASAVLVCGLGNTSFVGFPVIEAFYTRAGLPIAVIADQMGSFLILATLGTIWLQWHCGEASADSAMDSAVNSTPNSLPTSFGNSAGIWKKVATFPPFFALGLALLTAAIDGPSWLEWLSPVLSRLGSTLGPLALVTVGLRLAVLAQAKVGLQADGVHSARSVTPVSAAPSPSVSSSLAPSPSVSVSPSLARLANASKVDRHIFLAGLVYKLVVAPMAIGVLLLIYARSTHLSEDTHRDLRVLLLEAAMAPMITAAVMAEESGLEPELAVRWVGWGIPLSMLTLPLWKWLGDAWL